MMASPEPIETPVHSEAYFIAQWRAFAFRRYLALFLVFGWIPACVGFFLLANDGVYEPEMSAVPMVVWLLAAFGAVWWAGEFRCPRCRRRYASLGREKTVSLTRGLFDKLCPNCKLTKFEHTDPSFGA